MPALTLLVERSNVTINLSSPSELLEFQDEARPVLRSALANLPTPLPEDHSMPALTLLVERSNVTINLSSPSELLEFQGEIDSPRVHSRTAKPLPRFTPIGADGQDLPAGATDHVAVRDNHPHPDGLCRMYLRQRLGPFDQRECLNQAAACAALGFDDWRAPTRVEEEATLDLTRFKPARDTSLFDDDEGLNWTSTPDASDKENCAWFVVSLYGGASILHRILQGFVRPVRVCAPPASQ